MKKHYYVGKKLRRIFQPLNNSKKTKYKINVVSSIRTDADTVFFRRRQPNILLENNNSTIKYK